MSDNYQDLPIENLTYLDGWLNLAYERRRQGLPGLDASVRPNPNGPGVVVRVYSPADVEETRALIAAAQDTRARAIENRAARAVEGEPAPTPRWAGPTPARRLRAASRR
ncbi:hypothetical protein [Oerskovia merdavium]|uniref:Uncharacterized protein n=1 Tax=Oerskovia merdavium TaxID=2762227 RepID=A0ABR8U401_9CELL|nr:hypothetical protein [Oerskovia merdavium]MBD7982767.1 hypothetical protein [Oerskovia merdavium]